MNIDFLFACRVCHNPLLACNGDRGAVVDCPNCGGTQTIPVDPAFGTNPTKYLSELALLGESTEEGPVVRPMLRRIRLHRDGQGEIVRLPEVGMSQSLPEGETVQVDADSLKAELEKLREQVAEQNRQLIEWQTCHDSVEREFNRSKERKAALQAKINSTSNELAQVRQELSRARTEIDAARKANEVLNRQLQLMIKATKTQPPAVAPPSNDKGQPPSNPPGSIAA